MDERQMLEHKYKEIKIIKEIVSEIANVYIMCYDEQGNELFDFDEQNEDRVLIAKALFDNQIEDILQRLIAGGLEEQIIEGTRYINVRLSGTLLSLDNDNKIMWIIIGTLSDYTQQGYEGEVLEGFTRTTTDSTFNNLSYLLCYALNIRSSCANTISRLSKQLNNYKTDSSKAINHSGGEAFGPINRLVRSLDANDPADTIMDKFLSVIGDYLGATSGHIIRIIGNEPVLVMSEWKSLEERMLPYSKHLGDLCGLLDRRDNYILDESRVGDYNICSVIGIPIDIGGEDKPIVLFISDNDATTWTDDDYAVIEDGIVLLQNTLDKKIKNNSLASSYVVLESVLDNIGCAVYMIDELSGQIVLANNMTKSLFRNGFTSQMLNEEFTKEGSDEEGSYEVYSKRLGKWMDITRTEIRWVNGRNMLLYAAYDINLKKEYQKKIEQLAYTDFLTGLYNRMCCERDLAIIVDDAINHDKIGAVLYLDLDDFKHINDGLGHQYGDILLRNISLRLSSIKGIEQTCYRMGGDEFIIVLPYTQYDNVDEILDDIQQIFAAPWFLKDGDYYCTMSMGMVEFPTEGRMVEDLIKKADIAMYEAKKKGKNRVAKYSAKSESLSGKRLDMEKNMRNASHNGYKEFEVYIQPIIKTIDDDMVCSGGEALVRWNSMEMGFISPGEFIPLAEYLGLINPIGNYVLEEACKVCKKWNENGYPDYMISVNLSVVQLLQSDIVDIVKDIIDTTGINPENLRLEVTEGMAIDDIGKMEEIMISIKKLGVSFALDDFGTGYSSLSHIRKLPIDVIKVDQGFTSGLEENAYSRAFIRMISELSKTLNVKVCVEGVETLAQANILGSMDIDMVQGYYFGRPMQIADFEKEFTPLLQ